MNNIALTPDWLNRQQEIIEQLENKNKQLQQQIQKLQKRIKELELDIELEEMGF